MRPLRFAVVSMLALAVLAPAATPATAPRFVMPPQAAQGELVTIRATVKSGTRCFLTIKYADSAGESPASAVSRAGYANWRWRVSPTARLGVARATVRCGKAGSTTRTFTVVGRLIAPKIVVQQQGWSQRPLITGSIVSYGIMLNNPSPTQDAVNTFVLVNFVDGNNGALGSASMTIPLIGAGSTYALGNSINLRTSVPVARLEITIQNRGQRPAAAITVPQTQNIQLIPDRLHPEWLAEVDGEVVNDHETLTLGSTSLSIVLFDSAGQVVGGATGSTFSNVPAGSRLTFAARAGASGVPTSRATTAIISPKATYIVG